MVRVVPAGAARLWPTLFSSHRVWLRPPLAFCFNCRWRQKLFGPQTRGHALALTFCGGGKQLPNRPVITYARPVVPDLLQLESNEFDRFGWARRDDSIGPCGLWGGSAL